MHFDAPAVVLTSVENIDNIYFASGSYIHLFEDTVSYYQNGSILVSFDSIGNILWIKKTAFPNRLFDTQSNTLRILDDSTLILSGILIDSIRSSTLRRYNTNGDLMYSYEYLSPYHDENDFIYPVSSAVRSKNETYILNWIQRPDFNAQLYIQKIDSTGNESWVKEIGNSKYEIPEVIICDDNGGVIIGGASTTLTLTTQDYTYRTLLVGIDSSGNVEWTWLSPESWGLRDAARDMVLLEDGSLVIASGIGHEQQRPSVNVVYFDKAVFKLNPQRELEWEVVFPDPELAMNSYTSRIIQLKNKSGFVVAGVAKRPTPPGVWGSNRGWIAKISPSGDSLWSRAYVYSANFPSFHEFYDLKECPDGGFILCGESRSVANGDSIPQQAWLMKLDSFGCLVPGCQLIDATEEAEAQGTLLLYPNPARDYLNFFYRQAPGQSSRELSFRIFDASGRELQRFEAQSGEATYIVPLWHWSPGVYFLQLLHDGLPVRTERFVVGR
ncbi:MAG: hypothetical protein KatS3mg031_3089 [Chitinophagales bacterium]|nr:MAG: hypothetical protein KatS3mg031_3089 [Chitinophagales bacterium]